MLRHAGLAPAGRRDIRMGRSLVNPHRPRHRLRAGACLCFVVLLGSACAPGIDARPAGPETAPTPAPTSLSIEILYPSEGAEFVAGGPLRPTMLVTDAGGKAVDDARVHLTLRGPSGEAIAEVETVAGGQGVYRTPAWAIPQRAANGEWSVEVEAVRAGARATALRRVRVTPSISRILHDKYSFWIDPPTMKGIVSTLAAERGDAHNGMVRLGGGLPAAHILPAAWIDVQWRTGDFDLASPEAARRFLLEQIGDLGATRVRSLGDPEPFEFKTWQGWRMPARGRLRYEEVEWVLFYAPEVDRTFALGTTIVKPPGGIDAPEVLRSSFEVDETWEGEGVAPEPLPNLLPGPQWTAPELGEEFIGAQAEIVLRWEPLRELEPDEYYEVKVDYAYSEGTPLLGFATREPWLRLPPDLYDQPNCRVFNGSVRLMRSAGDPRQVSPEDVPLSHPSLLTYFLWTRPEADPAPFSPLCPNEQT